MVIPPMVFCPFCKSAERCLRIKSGEQSSTVSETGKKVPFKCVACMCSAEGPRVLGNEATDLAAVLVWNIRA